MSSSIPSVEQIQAQIPSAEQVRAQIPSAADVQASVAGVTSSLPSVSAVGASIAAGVKSAAVAVSQTMQSKVGSTLPAVQVKELDPSSSFALDTTGKIVIIGVPGAFTPTCSSQVPAYIEKYDQFITKGVKSLYVIAINDTFVLQAWSKKLAENGTQVRFISDDAGAFVSALGLVFDASALFGAPRAKRFALVAVDGVITELQVEASPGDLEVSDADSILARL